MEIARHHASSQGDPHGQASSQSSGRGGGMHRPARRLRQQIRRAEFIPSKKDLQSEVPDFHVSSTGCSMTMPSPPQHRIPHAGRQSVELKDRPAETKRMRRSVLSGSGRRAAQTGNECGEGSAPPQRAFFRTKLPGAEWAARMPVARAMPPRTGPSRPGLPKDRP